jgi:hypothetical protein
MNYADNLPIYVFGAAKKSKLFSQLADLKTQFSIKNEKNLPQYIKLFRAVLKLDKNGNKIKLDSTSFEVLHDLLLANEFIFSDEDFSSWINFWVLVLENFDYKELFNFIVNNNCFRIISSNKLHISVPDFNTFSLSKAIDLFNSLNSLKMDNNYIRFFTLLLLSNRYNHSVNILDYTNKINFDSLSFVEYEDIENQSYQFLILMFSPTPIIKDQLAMISLSEKFINHSNDFLANLLRIISNGHFLGNWQKNLVLELSKSNLIPKGLFLSYYNFVSLKAIAESIPVHISDEISG